MAPPSCVRLPWHPGPWRRKAYISHEESSSSGPSQSYRYQPLEGGSRHSDKMTIGNLDGYALEVTLTAANSAAQVSTTLYEGVKEYGLNFCSRHGTATTRASPVAF